MSGGLPSLFSELKRLYRTPAKVEVGGLRAQRSFGFVAPLCHVTSPGLRTVILTCGPVGRDVWSRWM